MFPTNSLFITYEVIWPVIESFRAESISEESRGRERDCRPSRKLVFDVKARIPYRDNIASCGAVIPLLKRICFWPSGRNQENRLSPGVGVLHDVGYWLINCWHLNCLSERTDPCSVIGDHIVLSGLSLISNRLVDLPHFAYLREDGARSDEDYDHRNLFKRASSIVVSLFLGASCSFLPVNSIDERGRIRRYGAI